MIIKLLIDGGNMTPSPAIAQQLGPKGINIGEVISKINESTKEFKGMKVPVGLDIDEKTKKFKINISPPPTSELLKKELKLEKGTANHKKQKVGNASIEEVIKITKIKFPQMLEKDFKTAIKSIIGTCASIGIFVENKEPKELLKDLEEGKFEKEINEQLTETAPEKRKELDDFFNGIKLTQEAKLLEEKKAAEEAEAAKATEVAPGKTPAEESKPGETAKPKETKSKDVKPKDIKPKDAKSKDIK
jgi:large subunit ribosomal protein L11